MFQNHINVTFYLSHQKGVQTIIHNTLTRAWHNAHERDRERERLHISSVHVILNLNHPHTRPCTNTMMLLFLSSTHEYTRARPERFSKSQLRINVTLEILKMGYHAISCILPYTVKHSGFSCLTWSTWLKTLVGFIVYLCAIPFPSSSTCFGKIFIRLDPCFITCLRLPGKSTPTCHPPSEIPHPHSSVRERPHPCVRQSKHAFQYCFTRLTKS